MAVGPLCGSCAVLDGIAQQPWFHGGNRIATPMRVSVMMRAAKHMHCGCFIFSCEGAWLLLGAPMHVKCMQPEQLVPAKYCNSKQC
jgi:hypothetical protein